MLKVNFMLEEVVKKELEELVPSGSRSKVVNEAIRRELLRVKRQRSATRLRALRKRTARHSGAEILTALREERRKRG